MAHKKGTIAKKPHSLLLRGSGDWNDGMNLVGEHGEGRMPFISAELRST